MSVLLATQLFGKSFEQILQEEKDEMGELGLSSFGGGSFDEALREAKAEEAAMGGGGFGGGGTAPPDAAGTRPGKGGRGSKGGRGAKR